MSNIVTALASENLNPSLRSLLEDVLQGHIRVPRFQRPFVWTDSQRLDLLRSIRDNMPIGSLLVWRTASFKLASFPQIGPHTIPPILESAPATGWQYLLDGHQRVSTLLGLLLQPSLQNIDAISGNSSTIDWNIQYDLFEQDFVFARKYHRKSTKRPLLPLWTLFDGRLVNKHMRDLRKLSDSYGWNEIDLDLWEERADQLAYRFQQCRIPIVVMVSDDLELAARTFQRINSLGTPMGESHLVAALTWRSDFDLRERLEDFRQAFHPGWRKLDEAIFLQVCKGLVGLDITKSGQAEFVRKLSDDKAALERAGIGLQLATSWLANEIGVTHEELLPYSLQLVLLAIEAAKQDDKNFFTKRHEKWFWRTSWSEVFATAAYRDIKFEQDLLQNATNSEEIWKWARDEKIPGRFDFRSARVRLFILRLARRGKLADVYGKDVEGKILVEKFGRDALVRLFSAPRNAAPSLKQHFQGPGNRFFVNPSDENILRERLMYGPDLSDRALEAHFINPDMLTSLREGNWERFMTMRTQFMEHWDLYEWMDECATSGGKMEINS